MPNQVALSQKAKREYISLTTYGYIHQIKAVDIVDKGGIYLEFEFEDITSNQTIKYISNVEDIEIVNKKLKEVNWYDIQEIDKIQLSLLVDKDETIVDQITIIDSQIDQELLGIYVSNNNQPIDNIAEIINDPQTVLLMSSKYGEMTIGRFVEYPEIDTTIEDYIYDMTYSYSLSYDQELLNQTIYIYLLTSEGTILGDTFDQSISALSKSYEGSVNLDSTDVNWVDNYEITYNINIHFESIPLYYEIFEYDENGLLVNQTILDSYRDFTEFSANDDAIRSVLVSHTSYSSNDYRKAYELLLGANLYLRLSNSYGIILNHNFIYS